MAKGENGETLTPATSVRLPLSVLLSVTVGILTGTITGTVSVYTMRDQILATARAADAETKTELRAHAAEDLTHYVTLEQFAEWRRQFEVKQDRQYYELLSALRGIQARLGAGR